jgi:uncharacterized protein YhaN
MEHERRSDDAVLRKLEILELQIGMMSNKIRQLSETQKSNSDSLSRLIKDLDNRLDRIEKFEKSVTGSWKGAVFTIIVIWAAFGDRIKSFFN